MLRDEPLMSQGKALRKCYPLVLPKPCFSRCHVFKEKLLVSKVVRWFLINDAGARGTIVNLLVRSSCGLAKIVQLLAELGISQ